MVKLNVRISTAIFILLVAFFVVHQYRKKVTPSHSVSQLKIEDVVVGKGDAARFGQTLTVHYTGFLRSGIKFDSSLYKGKPFKFKLGTKKVITGWDVGLLGMKPGGKRKLTIPPYMAYGTKGLMPAVPPQSELIYEVELLKIDQS